MARTHAGAYHRTVVLWDPRVAMVAEEAGALPALWSTSVAARRPGRSPASHTSLGGVSLTRAAEVVSRSVLA